MARRTKIIATLGPASDDPEVMAAMFTAGVDVVRLNLAHGDLDEHVERVTTVRRVAAQVGRVVAILADLPGPKIRANPFPPGGVELSAGSYVRLESGPGSSDAGTLRLEDPALFADLVLGDRVVLGDGAVSLSVVRCDGGLLEARVDTGGRTQGSPGVHLSSERLHLATPTAEDLVFAEAMAGAGVEYLAVSFVRTAADLEPVRRVAAGRSRLVAKIETSAALADLTALIESADAIMVARGDLGIDCPLEDVPHVQKVIVRECVERGTPVITATQMLESMITAPSPTRAEVSDIANAVFDGTDAVMLSGETAIGRDPVAVVTTMATVAERAEREAHYRQWADRLGRVQRSRWDVAGDRITAALCHAASQAARDVEASAIVCCTRSGRTARAMARFRPDATLIGLSPNPAVVAALAMSWGVVPMQVDTYNSTDELVWHAVETAVRSGLVHPGDTVLVLAGAPDRPSPAAADVLRIVEVH
jgi:pyruvate kinase